MSKYLYKEDVYFNNNEKAVSRFLVMLTAGTQLRFDKSIKLNFTCKHFKTMFSNTD